MRSRSWFLGLALQAETPPIPTSSWPGHGTGLSNALPCPTPQRCNQYVGSDSSTHTPAGPSHLRKQRLRSFHVPSHPRVKESRSYRFPHHVSYSLCRLRTFDNSSSSRLVDAANWLICWQHETNRYREHPTTAGSRAPPSIATGNTVRIQTHDEMSKVRTSNTSLEPVWGT